MHGLALLHLIFLIYLFWYVLYQCTILPSQRRHTPLAQTDTENRYTVLLCLFKCTHRIYKRLQYLCLPTPSASAIRCYRCTLGAYAWDVDVMKASNDTPHSSCLSAVIYMLPRVMERLTIKQAEKRRLVRGCQFCTLLYYLYAIIKRHPWHIHCTTEWVRSCYRVIKRQHRNSMYFQWWKITNAAR